MRQFAAAALVTALALVGCAPVDPQPSPPASGPTSPSTPAASPTDTAASPTDTAPSPTESAPAADPELDAFRAALAGHSPADPEALVAAVVAAGFDRATIERTDELDSLGKPVTFLEIAVLLGESCLIGQVGDGAPSALRSAALGGGRCLVGDVIALD